MGRAADLVPIGRGSPSVIVVVWLCPRPFKPDESGRSALHQIDAIAVTRSQFVLLHAHPFHAAGSLEVPELGSAEPLKTKLQHFASCVLDPAVECIASGQLGALVTRMLTAIERSMKSNGAPVLLADVN